jgi:hypothetical protein
MTNTLDKGKIGFWNCGGGLRSKYYFVKDFLLEQKLSMFFISESEITEDSIGILTIPGYDLLIAKSVGKSRMACYIRSEIKYKQLTVKGNLDMIVLDIDHNRVIGLYRGFKLSDGDTRSSFFQTIINSLNEFSRTEKNLLIGGDFNVDLYKKSANLNDLQNWSINFGLQQLTDKCTWRRVISGEIHESAIDHVYTSENNLNLTYINSVSDHDILVVSKVIRFETRTKIELRDWRGYTKEKAHVEFQKRLSELSIKQNLSLNSLTTILNEILNVLAPKRVIRVKPSQIVSHKVEKLKKKRDRKYRAYKKTKDPEYLKSVNDLNKDIRIALKKESSRIFQNKAKSKDPKTFWQAVNQSMGKGHSQIIEIVDEKGAQIKDSEDLANSFANFFKGKVEKLSTSNVNYIRLPLPTNPVMFSLQELEQVFKNVTGKKCHGPDGIPQNLLKDVNESIPEAMLNIVNNFASNGLPMELKEARVLPLHKKGSKTEVSNYRPISNVSSMSKIFEKCLLKRLDEETKNFEGSHQHGFRQKHSTETALIMLQSDVSQVLESKKPGLIYSIDLSAAFDLLKPDKFFELFKNDLSEGLMFSLMDFLQNRTFHVEVRGTKSSSLKLDRGCVQGSVLGPRLFSMYVGKLEMMLKKCNSEAKVISYADDSYVIISCDTEHETAKQAERLLITHVSFLRDLGMIVNESKTEFMWLGGNIRENLPINVAGTVCHPVNKIKALGILIDGVMSWDHQAEKAIKKGQKLLSIFKFLRNQMDEKQFLKAVTANYYSSVFYCSSVWYPNVKMIHRTKLISLHFRLLRTACKDFNASISRESLSERCQKATPDEWSKYTTASLAMKVWRDGQPERLKELLTRTFYTERRNRGKGMFYDESKTRHGKQSIQNRLQHVSSVTNPWSEKGQNLTNNQLRVMLKKTFFKYTAINGTVGNQHPQRVAPIAPTS